jgi:hypothetical protein
VSAVAAVLALFAVGASAAAASELQPWWNLNTSVRPSVISSGGEGTIVVQALDVGDGCTSKPGPDGKTCTEDDEGIPTTLSATLPAGMEVVEEEVEPGVFRPELSLTTFRFGHGNTNFARFCAVAGSRVTCTLPGALIFAPFEEIELRVGVRDVGATPSAEYVAEVGGGGAATVSRHRPVRIADSAPPFGAEALSLVPEFEGGGVDAHAGSHPFQLTATFNLNQTADVEHPPALPKDLHFRLPPGQLGNVVALPKCTALQFATYNGGSNLCPASSALGVANVNFYEPANLGLKNFPVPLFNLEPKRGEPARFGFEVAKSPVILDTALRSGNGEDYGVTVTAANVTELTNFLTSTLTFWGAPGDPRHDESRGWECLASGFWTHESGASCSPSLQTRPPAFLTLPTNCAAPFRFSAEGVSWPTPASPGGIPLDPFTYSLEDEAGAPLGLTGCNQLPFAPSIEAEPTTSSATSPTGFNFDINFDDEGLLNAEGLAQSQLKKAVVTLPEGFTTNPSVAEGLQACSQAQYESETVESGPATGCPEASKIGEVEIDSPLVEPTVHGSLYVAKQHANPYGNLLTLYLVAKNAEIGVLVKQALKVVPDPVTGQLKTEVDNVPQLPFSRFHLSFRQGQRSPLISPPACGPYTVTALLSPWSNPAATVERQSSFQITQGPEGQGCPSGGVPPFHPNLEAGTINNAAGTYSPFYTHITRKDSEQEITRFSIKLPTGVIGKLAGVSECSDAAVAHAKALEVEGGGALEEASPSCPKNSEIGHSLVGSGVGNVLAYAPGKLYLAGPYHGSQLSIVSITAAKVGPFDLGTVVVRFALKINPETTEVSVDGAQSDPIPHIVDGIPVHLRDIRAYVDRPNFTLNPTSCAKKSTASTILGSGLNFASSSDDVPVTVSSPFQAADCASLGFKPALKLSLKGSTKRSGVPKFKAVLTYPKNGAYANIAKAQVTLPSSEFLEQNHIGTVCTRVQFAEGSTPGEKCPAASVYGHASAVTPLLDDPISGPVYLRANGGERELPDLVAALHSGQINVDVVGFIDSVHQKGSEVSRIRNTFAVVPDAPVSKFTLELLGAKKGLLVNSTNICNGTHRAKAQFTAQNGKLHEFNPPLEAQCGGKKKAKKSAKRSSLGFSHR